MTNTTLYGILAAGGFIVAAGLEYARSRKKKSILNQPMYRDKYEYLECLENQMHYWQGEYNAASDDEQLTYTFNQMMYYQGQAEQVAAEIEAGDMQIH